MKHLKQIAIIVLIILLVAGTCMAANSSVTCTDRQSFLDGAVRTVTISWIGDDATGAIPATSTDDIILFGTSNQTVTSWMQGYYIFDVEVDPGLTAPTALYDIAITSEGGASLTNGSSDDLSATVTQRRRPSGYSGAVPWMGEQSITGPITLTWSNTTVNSSTGTITLFLRKP